MNFPSKKVMPRYFLVTLVLGIISIAVMVKAAIIIFVEQDHWMEKKEEITKSTKKHTEKAKRGNILACDGRILATSLSEYKLYLDFRAWKGEKNPKWREKDQYLRDSLYVKYRDTLALVMHQMFPDIDQKKWLAHMNKGFEKKSQYWPLYPPEVTSLKLGRHERKNRQLTYLEVSELRKLPLFNRKSSLNAVEIPMRKMPYGEMAYRTIGKYIEDARFGLERSFDSILSGKPGEYYREKIFNQYTKRVIKEPVNGSDILTTLDIDIQDICERVLREELANRNADSGVCIVMEVATGDIKGISSLQRDRNGEYHENSPNAVTTHYEPGSVFKPMSFLVAFDDQKIKITDEVDINGGVFKFGSRTLYDANYKSGGAVGPRDVKYIIQNSSNVGTARLIDQQYLSDPQKFIDGLYRVGVGEDLKVPIDGYWPPHICSPKDTKRYWSRTDLPWMSIGYVTQIPPINTLAFYNGIANNGKMLRPRFVKAILRNGQIEKELPTVVVREQMARPEAIQDIKTCLLAVVNGGSGKKVASKNFQIAGKTGTAQIWLGGRKTSDYSISFVGFFPADNPKYSCIVNIQKAPPAYGWHSGEVFKRIAEYIMAQEMENKPSNANDSTLVRTPETLAGESLKSGLVMQELGITPNTAIETEPTSLDFNELRMPNLNGYGLRDALTYLEKMDLRVKITGSGIVTQQSIAPGKSVQRGETVHLVLNHQRK